MTTDQAETIDPGTDRFWSGLLHGTLYAPRCNECGTLVWFPRAQCPRCMSGDLSWEELSGRGTVYSFTVNRRGMGRYAGRPPFVIAYVELDEGPRVIGHVEGVEPGALVVGQRLGLAPRDAEAADDDVLLTFVPADE